MDRELISELCFGFGTGFAEQVSDLGVFVLNCEIQGSADLISMPGMGVDINAGDRQKELDALCGVFLRSPHERGRISGAAVGIHSGDGKVLPEVVY